MIVYEEETENYLVKVEQGSNEEGDTFVFLHLDVYKFNRKILNELKVKLEDYITKAGEEGHEIVSFYLPKDKKVKFHSLVKPIEFSKVFGPEDQYVLYGWYTGKK